MQHTLSLAPYYHPTTICLVDDNQSFLDSLHLELPSGWACITFTQPEEALEFLNTPPKLAPLVDRCFSVDSSRPDSRAISLDLGLIDQEIHHLDRFSRVSVALVDYAMPSLDGLELCAQLNDPYLRKVMLTGVADEKVAVQAFNDGLIHRFIAKHTARAMGEIRRHVVESQHAYFDQYTARLQTTLAVAPPAFLTDPVVADYVHALMRERDLVEYYLVSEPNGLLLLNRDGVTVRLVVQSAAEMREQHSYAVSAQAPRYILERLAAGTGLCFFWDHPDNYHGDEAFPWSEQLLDCSTLQGIERWHLALAEEPPSDIDFDAANASYAAYLRSLS